MTRKPRVSGDSDRGQFVLAAATVVVLALVVLLAAYLQLGYQPTMASQPSSAEVFDDGRAFLERASDDATADVPKLYAWSERRQAVTVVRNRLGGRIDTLEGSRVDDGIAYQVSMNRTAASHWVGSNCPSGPGRQFGNCRTDRGVVVQERDGRTHVLAVAFDLTATTERGETTATIVVEPVGG